MAAMHAVLGSLIAVVVVVVLLLLLMMMMMMMARTTARCVVEIVMSAVAVMVEHGVACEPFV